MVPAPPEPAAAMAETLVPVQMAPAAGVGVRVPDTGNAFMVQVTTLAVDVVQPDPVAVR